MLNLLDSCSLDISVDLDSSRLVCGDKVKHNGFNRVKLHNILPSLLNKSLSYPEDIYDVYQKIFCEEDVNIAESDLSYDVIFLPAGLLGVEYLKTHIYFSPDSVAGHVSSIVEVQFGILTIILQKNKVKTDIYEFETQVDEGIMVKLHKGEKMAIPQGYLYTFINTEENPVIFVRVYRVEGIIDYSILKRERGMAYYCIRKNARQEIVLNPAYKNTPKIAEQSPATIDALTTCVPLYQLLRQELNLVFETL